MKIPLLSHCLALMILAGCSSHGSISVSKLTCDGQKDPQGTGRNPQFGWINESDARGALQSGYRILVSENEKDLDKNTGTAWDSGKTGSVRSAWISYGGTPLKPGTEYFWKVQVWDGSDKPSPWSGTGRFITGLFSDSDWKGAGWIGYEEIADSLLLVPGVHGSGDGLGQVALKRTVVPFFRKEFTPAASVRQAVLFVSGLGHYELSVNGNRIGDRFLSPGWTDYRKTCLYNVFDVTPNLKQGTNAIGMLVGNGFYNINRERYRKLVIAYGAPKLKLVLRLIYDNGKEENIISDGTWKTSPSPVTFASIYGGEDYDARLEQKGWDEPGFNDSGWKNAIAVREPSGTLKPEIDYPVKVEETIGVKNIYIHKDSVYTYDFGQNASGIIKIKVRGEKGKEIRLIPGELLDEDSLVTQKATGEPYYLSYILKGEGEETWAPRFTYYGFRYARLEGAVPAGYPGTGGKPVVLDAELLHTRNSAPATGSFRCSSDLFNSVYSLINWAIKSNMASVATDCPHREKLGWLEQTHLMGSSIKFNYDIHNLFARMIDDMAEAQLENGLVPDIAPEYVPFAGGFRDSPEWGSACVILPWDLYEWYGDTAAVRKAYPMMKKYVGYLNGLSKDYILTHGLGDWYDLGPEFPGEAQLTPRALTATSIWFYDAKLLSEMASVLGEKDDAAYFGDLAEKIRLSFNSLFLDPVTKVYSTGSQTAYSMPLYFGMPDDTARQQVVSNLVRSVINNNKALTAGDIGYRYLLRALEEEGQSQLIWEMNSRSDVPGYGYQLSKGATSLTESWPALKYVSNNHMMLGHLMEWFYSGLAGIRQAPGSTAYSRIIIDPQIVGDIKWVDATYESVNGLIAVSWKIENSELTLSVRIPVGCSATVAIPGSDVAGLTENGQPAGKVAGLKVLGTEKRKILCEIASGSYLFKTSYK